MPEFFERWRPCPLLHACVPAPAEKGDSGNAFSLREQALGCSRGHTTGTLRCSITAFLSKCRSAVRVAHTWPSSRRRQSRPKVCRQSRPRLVEPGPKLVELGRTSSEISRIRVSVEFAPQLVEVGRFGRHRPISAKVGPDSSKVGPRSADLAVSRQSSARFGPGCGPVSIDLAPTSAKTCPASSATCGPPRPAERDVFWKRLLSNEAHACGTASSGPSSYKRDHAHRDRATPAFSFSRHATSARWGWAHIVAGSSLRNHEPSSSSPQVVAQRIARRTHMDFIREAHPRQQS